MLVGEVWLPDIERFAQYLRPDELHTAFNFDFMARPWDAASLRDSIDATLAAHAPVGAPATWVLSNHDVTRPVTRYGRADTLVRLQPQALRRADRPRARSRGGRAPPRCSPPRCPARCTSTRATSSGFAEVEDPDRPDPGPDARPVRRHRPRPRRLPRAAALERRRGALRLQPGRIDRTSLADAAGRIGRASPSRPQAADPDSMLNLYRTALPIRRDEPDLGDGPLTWWSSPPDTLAFARGPRFLSLTNLSGASLPLPPHEAVLLASVDVADHHLPPDATVWLRPAVDGAAEPAWRLPDEDR